MDSQPEKVKNDKEKIMKQEEDSMQNTATLCQHSLPNVGIKKVKDFTCTASSMVKEDQQNDNPKQGYILKFCLILYQY